MVAVIWDHGAPFGPRTQPTQFRSLRRLDKGLITARTSDVRLWA